MPRHRALAQTLNIALLFPAATMASMSGRYASSSPLASRVIPQNKVKKIIPTPASVKSGSPWPYTAEDLRRHDESPDVQFYSHPRFVTHIDGGCIDSLRDNVCFNFSGGDDVLDCARPDLTLSRLPSARIDSGNWNERRGAQIQPKTGIIRVQI